MRKANQKLELNDEAATALVAKLSHSGLDNLRTMVNAYAKTKTGEYWKAGNSISGALHRALLKAEHPNGPEIAEAQKRIENAERELKEAKRELTRAQRL